MKSPGAVKHKLQQVRFRYMKKWLEEGLAQQPEHCIYHTVLSPHTVGVVVCTNAQLNGFGANPVHCTPECAQSCPLYENIHTKESLKESFKDALQESSVAELAYKYPDMVALQWVLEEDVPFEIPPEESETISAPVVDRLVPETLAKPEAWYQSLWRYLFHG